MKNQMWVLGLTQVLVCFYGIEYLAQQHGLIPSCTYCLTCEVHVSQQFRKAKKTNKQTAKCCVVLRTGTLALCAEGSQSRIASLLWVWKCVFFPFHRRLLLIPWLFQNAQCPTSFRWRWVGVREGEMALWGLPKSFQSKMNRPRWNQLCSFSCRAQKMCICSFAIFSGFKAREDWLYLPCVHFVGRRVYLKEEVVPLSPPMYISFTGGKPCSRVALFFSCWTFNPLQHEHYRFTFSSISVFNIECTDKKLYRTIAVIAI